MTAFAAAVDVEAPTARVWAAVTDWDRQGEWIVATVVRRTAGAGKAPGDQIEAFTGVGPIGVRDPMVITAWGPPYRCLVRHGGRVLRGAGSFEVAQRPGGGARVTWTEWLEPPFGVLGAVGMLLARPGAELMLSISLRRFARYCRAQ